MTQLLHQNIIALFGLTAASPAAKNQVLGRLVELVEKRVMVAVLDRLPPEDQEEFLRIVDEGTDEERTVFLQTHVPDIGKMIDQEVMYVKQQAQQFATQHARAAA